MQSGGLDLSVGEGFGHAGGGFACRGRQGNRSRATAIEYSAGG